MKIHFVADVIHVGGAFATRDEVEQATLGLLQMGGDDIVAGDASYDIDDVSLTPDPERLVRAARAAARILRRLANNATTDPIRLTAAAVRLEAETEKYR